MSCAMSVCRPIVSDADELELTPVKVIDTDEVLNGIGIATAGVVPDALAVVDVAKLPAVTCTVSPAAK